MSTWSDERAETRSGWHPVNVTHLVMGIAFAGMLVIWAAFVAGDVAESDLRWLLPIPWLAAGAAGLAATLLPSRRAAPEPAHDQSAPAAPEAESEERDFLGERIDAAARDADTQQPGTDGSAEVTDDEAEPR